MSKLQWDKLGEHLYENGSSHAVLYTPFPNDYPTRVAKVTTVSIQSGGRIGLFVTANAAEYYQKENYRICPALKAEEYNNEFGEGETVVPIQAAGTTFWVCTSRYVSSYELYRLNKNNTLPKLSEILNLSASALVPDSEKFEATSYTYGGVSNSYIATIGYTYGGEVVDSLPEGFGDLAFGLMRYESMRYYDDGENVIDFVYNDGTNLNGNGSVACSYFGTVWNGITGITESGDGADANDMWADNLKYASTRSNEEFGLTVEAYTYPDAFGYCDGTEEPVRGVKFGQQSRMPFCLSYRTEIGNDTASDSDDGYLLHLVYNATASPSDRSYETINDSPDAITFSWEMTTTPVKLGSIGGMDFSSYKPISHITINSKKVDPEKLEWLETFLYGSDNAVGSMPSPEAVLYMFTDTTNSEEENNNE